ncbi:polysaccharide deacetylase family protein [Nonomuraea lactucae]|uniref:polysaccharide deacetylase family protein n=1 Tax=Nonomuraea lactucae TaxID=2249762 RepID=UPI0013B36E78|nr:polysaccharide deacetylase family protein [Nonomuraea lactucae]
MIHGLLALSLVISGAPATGARTGAQARVDCAKVKCIALTFDDGPGKQTPALLDVLRKEKVKATFFLMGKRVERHPAIARRAAAEGHALGNHTYGHPSLPSLLDDEILDELGVTQAIIREKTGKRVTMFRPPYGHTDDRVLRVAGEQGLAQVMWTGTTLDWDLRDTARIRSAVLRLARRDGVILLHDTVPETVKAMPSIVKELRKRGYHLVTVPALLGGERLEPGVSYP